MPRDTSPYVVGDFWLEKRKHAKSPYWQIASYNPSTRSVHYRSSRERDLEAAKAVIRAYEAEQRAKGKQEPDEAAIAMLLLTYWNEHGKHVESPGQIASSIRVVMGFLNQDETGPGAVVSDLGVEFQQRFLAWRTGPHEYDVAWSGKRYKHKSEGVSGETVQRNLEDLRAGIMHHVNRNRIPNMPRLPSVPDDMRSEARERVLSWKELGAMLGYAEQHDRRLYQYLCLMLGTAVRPVVARSFDPAKQYDAEFGFIDLHPEGKRRTKKRNAVIPAIPPLAAMFDTWEPDDGKGHRSAWRTMRRALNLDGVMMNTIRHTVATRLRADSKCPNDMIGDLLGHDMKSRTTRGYAKYDPAYMQPVKAALVRIWERAMTEKQAWSAGHLLVTPKRGQKLEIARRDGEC